MLATEAEWLRASSAKYEQWGQGSMRKKVGTTENSNLMSLIWGLRQAKFEKAPI